MVLLYFIQWLKNNYPDKYCIGILHFEGGELEQKFNILADDVFYLSENPKVPLVYRLANKISKITLDKHIKENFDKQLQKIYKKKYRIIYANSVLSLWTAVNIKKNTNLNFN